MASGIWEENVICRKQIVKRRKLTPDIDEDSDRTLESDHEESKLSHLTKLVATLTESVTKMCPASVSPKVTTEVVPTFNPEDKNQNVLKWIKKVDELRSIYGWDEKTTIFYATTRLRGLANTWYQSLTTIDFSWEDWKIKLREAFPVETDYDQQLEEMLRRTKKKDESMMNYFYEKLGLLNVCEISGRKAVACLIGGIPDATIKAAAKVKDFDQPEGLLRFLKTLSDDKSRGNSSVRKENLTSKPASLTHKRKCYGCGSRNHILPQCPNRHNSPVKKTQFKDTAQNSRPVKQVLTLEEAESKGNKYFKVAYINGVCVDIYVDLGATCNVMKKEILSKLKLRHNSHKQYIKGYGGSVVETLGVIDNVLVKIDNVEAKTQFLVVPNYLQKVPVIIGQPFTEETHVVLYKDSHNLHMFDKEIFPLSIEILPHKTKLRLEKTAVVPPAHAMNVICNSEENGTFYVDSSIRLKENNEYFVPRCIIKTNVEGKCIIPVINPTHREVVIKPKNIFARAIKWSSTAGSVMSIDLEKEKAVSKFESLNIGEFLSEEQTEELLTLLRTYEGCFASSLSELGCTRAAELNIDLVDEKAVVYRPYRMNQSSREKVREIVAELLENDIIRESNSPFSSPVLLVKKKSGEQRLCIDYRMLNSKIKQDHFPLPRMDDQLDYLQGHKYFTSLDMTSGYYQIPVAETSKYKTSFVTPDGQFEFNRMPFGISTAPAVFQRIINKILGPLRGTVAVAYLDDILIPSKDFEGGIERLELVLKTIRKHNLTLNPSKCHFFKTSITYLGFEIDSEGMKPGLEKTKCVENFAVPKNVHQVRQFLGLTGFFRQFVKDYAVITRPLTNLTKKDRKWTWGAEEQEAFLTLKRYLTKRPILSIYNPKADTEVHTDASKLGVAGILLQKSEDGKLHPVAYYSRRTNKSEENYHSYELETLAVVESLRKFRIYLLDINFKVVTDCNSIKMAAKKKDLIPRIARWWLLLQEFTFTIEYRSGTKMAHVDALSRNPDTENEIQMEHEILHIEVADWILANQISDDKIKAVQDILNKSPNTEYENKIHKEYKMENGRIYKITKKGLKWVVPKGMRNEVVRTAHDELGHFGVEKTLKKLSESYWFPEMQKYVERYIRSCIPCLYSKQPKGKLEGFLSPIEKVPEPFHTIHMDHLGPFVKSTSGKKYIVVCVDSFTKYSLLRAVKDTKTLPVLNFLDHIIGLFGVPKRIITDQGTCYTSKAFAKYCEKRGLQHVQNAVATPRANGQVERYNSTILAALKATTDESTKWDKELTKIQFGLNNTMHSVTKKTPSQLLLGFTPTSPADAQLSSLTAPTKTVISDREAERTEVAERIKKSQEQQKSRYDLRRKPSRDYKTGDLVLVRKNVSTDGESKKLVPKYKGPFQILKKLRHDRYLIEEIPGSHRSRKTLHKSIEAADRMKPWMPKGGKSDTEDEEEGCMNEDVH